MPQHPTPHPPTPTDFQTQLLTCLDEIIGLLDTLTTTLADKIAVALAAVSPMGLGMGVVILAGMFAGLWVWKRRSVSVPAAVGFYLAMVVVAIVG